MVIGLKLCLYDCLLMPFFFCFFFFPLCQMLALAVLDRILSIDRQSQWLLYICNSGYLRSLVESLRQDDGALQSLLLPQPPLLKPLYIYESKMVRGWPIRCDFLKGTGVNVVIIEFVLCASIGSPHSCGQDGSGSSGAPSLWARGSAHWVPSVWHGSWQRCTQVKSLLWTSVWCVLKKNIFNKHNEESKYILYIC